MGSQKVWVKVEHIEGVLEVENFKISFTHASYPYKPRAREFEANAIKSGPILKAGGHEFRIIVCWSLDSELHITPHSMLGVVVERVSKGSPPAAEIEFELENSDASLSRRVIFSAYQVVSTSGTYPTPYANAREHLDGIALLKDVIDCSKGFLHEGTLKVKCKMRVSTSENMSYSSSSPSTSIESDLGSQLKELKDSGRHTDVQIRVSSEVLHVHTVILSARSKVFDAMLSHRMREMEHKIVVIEDLEHKAVSAMIDFMYTDKLETQLGNDDDTSELLKAAHKYQVDKLTDLCVRALSSNLTVELAVKNLMLADLIGDEILKRNCVDYITGSSDRMADVQQVDEFKHLAKARPHLLTELLSAAFPAVKRRKLE